MALARVAFPLLALVAIAAGAGGAPADAQAAGQAPLLREVGGLRAVAISASAVRARWRDRSRGESRYELRAAGRRTRLRPNARRAVTRGLAPGRVHRFAVRPCRRRSCARWRTVSVRTPAVPAQSACDRGPVVDVRDAGASGDGSTDDRAAIEAAVAALGEGGGTVHFPAGRYRVERAVHVTRGGITFEGAPGAVVVSDPLPEPALPFGLMGALLVNDADPQGGVRDVEGICVRDLSFEALGGPESESTSVVQLNGCVECTVERVEVRWGDPAASPAEKPRNLDGITFAQRSSGTIRDVLVDGIPKVGIYVAGGLGGLEGGSRDVAVADSVVSGSGASWQEVDAESGTVVTRRWGTGVSVSGAQRVAFERVRSYDNLASGALVGVNGDGADGVAAERVTLAGGEYSGNGEHGVAIGSGAVSNGHDLKPRQVTIAGIEADGNGGSGIAISAGREVAIDTVAASGNGYHGLLLQNTSIPRIAGLTSAIEVTRSNFVANSAAINAGAGVFLRAVDDVQISSSELAEHPQKPGSARATLYPAPDGSGSSDIELLDLDVGGRLVVEPGGEAASGRFELTGLGSPNSYRGIGLPAPTGSTFRDAASGIVYSKLSAALDPGGWVP